MHPESTANRVLEMLVLQSTPFCNLDCSYCYLPHRSNTRRMSEATLAQALDRVFGSPFLSDRLTILWHAGEPLVPGIAYYRRAFEIIEAARPPGLAISHSIQTNATLLDEKWVRFFAENDVRVGVSIDGPADLHDRCRKNRRGAGTFSDTMRGIGVLRDLDYPFHVITVLTRPSLGRARELFEFYVGNGIRRVAFNVEEIEGEHAASSLEGASIEREMRAFLRSFLDLIEELSAPLEVREFAGALGAILDPKSGAYGNPLAQPMRIVSVGVDGDLGTFSPELLGYGTPRHGPFAFGNVGWNDLADMLRDPRFGRVSAEIESGLARCRRGCEYFEFCRGGAPVNKLFENGTFDSAETLFCRLIKKAVIDVVLERVEERLSLAC